LPRGLLKYEHIARAAIGCALCASLRGNDTEAMRWLDAVAEVDSLPDSVREQVLPRRIAILARAGRWDDLERLVRVERRSDRSGGGPEVRPLPALPARLLAVAALDAKSTSAHAAPVIDQLARLALGDLVAANQVGHLLDLAKRYGTAPIGDHGFIVHFVRGMQFYEEARTLHAAGAEDPQEPTRRPELTNQYAQAADLLERALAEPDAAAFGAERSRAAMMLGLARFYAGRLLPAAEAFLEVSSTATGTQGEEALWLAVLAFDRAARAGDTSAAARRDQAAALFLQQYAASERAAKLLLGLGPGSALDDQAAVGVLMKVTPESPLYEPARRQAARLLYGLYRAARGQNRDFAAVQFLGVAEQVLAMDRRAAASADPVLAREAAARVVQRARQILDAALGTSVPDAARAQAALDVLDSVAATTRVDLSAHREELAFRRLQVALARNDSRAVATLAPTLAALQGPFADAADRLLFRRAADAVAAAPSPDAESLRTVVAHGSRIIARTGSSPAVLADPSVLWLHSTVAAAAVALLDAPGGTPDPAHRELAVRLDSAILAAQPRNEASLRRLARTSEDSGDTATALRSWSTLAAGLDVGSPAWFEARYHQLRLLAAADAVRARQLLAQHRALYPTLGPDPWGTRMRELESKLGPATAPVPGDPP
ncbi:MAG TPA: hypothetical protein VD963_01495, partial [Phycisphaerales bacterium]|nr:hypothetical protein [Phycisphaerales bacterium]